MRTKLNHKSNDNKASGLRYPARKGIGHKLVLQLQRIARAYTTMMVCNAGLNINYTSSSSSSSSPPAAAAAYTL